MFGAHLSIAGGLHNALLAAEALGLESVQVFANNQTTRLVDTGGVKAVRKPRLTSEEAGNLAVGFVQLQVERGAASGGKWSYHLLGVRRCNVPNLWVATFRVGTADGSVVDSGPMVVVDDESGDCHFYEFKG